jgi:hypothetical protein
MAYTIYNTDGTTLLLLADNTVDQSTTSLSLVGKNVNGYGQFVNNNFVKILANSASTAGSPPRSPLTGQLWFDTTARRLKVYDGSFKPVSGAFVVGQDTPPVNPVSGDLWFDSTNYQLNTYFGGSWSLVGPAFQARVGENGWTIPPGNIRDIYLLPQQVTLMKNYGQTLGVISSATFITTDFTTATTLAPSDTLEVVRGLTVFGSIQATGDVRIYNTLTVANINSEIINNSNYIDTVNLTSQFLEVSGRGVVTSTSTSISTTTGALIVSGGVGIGGDLYVGGRVIAQELEIQYTTVTTVSIKTDDVFTTYNTSESYSTTTGALVIAGGAGIGGSLFVGNTVTATNLVVANFTATNFTATNATITNFTATNATITNFTATNATLTNAVIMASLNMGGNTITNMADPAADTDAVNRRFLYNRNIVLSMDVSDGLDNAGIITYLAQIAPVAEYTTGTTARILCTTIANTATSVPINAALTTTLGTFLITTSTSGDAVTGVSAIDPTITPPVTVSRVVKTFAISGGLWTFVS